jgi:sarcosine oxidase subunit alpha
MNNDSLQTISNGSLRADLVEVEECERLLGHAFPESYKTYLLTKNGQTGLIGDNYVRFYSVQELQAENYQDWLEFFPNTLRIGDTGALENFVVNYHFSPPRFGMLPQIGNMNDFIDLGTEWSQLIDRLAKDTLWEKSVQLTVNGANFTVPAGTTVAAAVVATGAGYFRRSISGEPRAPLCGMGICFECRATINGVQLQRSCSLIAKDGMEVYTDE